MTTIANVKNLKQSDFNSNGSLKGNGRPGIVLVWAHWCGACKNFLKTYERLGKEMSNHLNVLAVESEQLNKNIMEQLGGISSYPSLRLIDGTGKVVFKYTGPRDYFSLVTVLCKQLKVCV